MKKIILAGLAISAMAFAGCETTSSRPYSASTKNIIAFQKAVPTGSSVSVSQFQAAADVDMELTCRLLGALEVAPGKTATQFIEDAFQEELFDAGVFDANGTPITGMITQYEADSYGTGKWEIGLNLSSPNLPQGLDVATVYEFKSSYTALKACQNVVDAFTPAVQSLIAEAIEHPDFATLVR